MKAKRFLTIGLPIVLATTGIAGTSIALVSCSSDKNDTQKINITMQNKSTSPTFGGNNDIVISASFPSTFDVKTNDFKWQYQDTDNQFKDIELGQDITNVLSNNVATLTIKSTKIDEAGTIKFRVISTNEKVTFENNSIDVTVANGTINPTSFASTTALQLENFIKIGTSTSSLSGLTNTNITTSNTGTTTLTVTATGIGTDGTTNYVQVDLSKITASVFTASSLPAGATISFALASDQSTNWTLDGTTVTSKNKVSSSTNTLKVVMTVSEKNYNNLTQEITFTFNN